MTVWMGLLKALREPKMTEATVKRRPRMTRKMVVMRDPELIIRHSSHTERDS